MRADDDGFVNSPKKIIRMVGASNDDMNILLMRKFVIAFDSGVVVIKHWRIHNYIRRDTYKETNYKEEKATLAYDENNAYTQEKLLSQCPVDDPSTTRQRSVDDPWTQDRIGKDRLGKSRLGEKENEISDDISQKKISKKEFAHDSKAYKCARWLSKQVLARYPCLKPHDEKTLQTWSDDIDKCNRIDGYEWEDISDVIRFSQEDKFWQQNIRSGAAVRKQFETLLVKMLGKED